MVKVVFDENCEYLYFHQNFLLNENRIVGTRQKVSKLRYLTECVMASFWTWELELLKCTLIIYQGGSGKNYGTDAIFLQLNVKDHLPSKNK